MPILYNSVQIKTIKMQNVVVIPLQGQSEFLVLYFCIYSDSEAGKCIRGIDFF